jgi:hypothetical protein
MEDGRGETLPQSTSPQQCSLCPTARVWLPSTRGLHSFTSQLNLSGLYGIRGTHRACVACVKEVLWGIQGV